MGGSVIKSWNDEIILIFRIILKTTVFLFKWTEWTKRCALGWKKLKSQKEGDFSPLKSNHTLEYTPIFRLRLTSIAPAAPILQKNSVLVLGMCNPLFNVCVHAQWTPNIPFLYIWNSSSSSGTCSLYWFEYWACIAKGKSLISQLS